MSFELLDLFKVSFGREIPHNEFESCQTPGDILRLINRQVPPQLAHLVKKVQPIASKWLTTTRRGPDTAEPIYLIHDGSGVCSAYSTMSGLGRTVLRFSCDPENRFESISDMAECYTRTS
ncbi:hypothetical protein RRF57_013398 [Xylaria bambusicola]|uniref:Uncharacterized protein n=1 Tax=Xylaria bambusicola TaxID=326684 RepID=A0AAN7V0R1_9PEZI